MRILSIDFGTSNTVAALAVDGQMPRALTFFSSPLVPSAVFLDPDGRLTVGREAERQARLDPSRFEPNPKRRIDEREILLGDRVVPTVDVIAAVFRTVLVEARRQLGGQSPDQVRLTHPADWGTSRRAVLIEAAKRAGVSSLPILLPEPVAAAAQYSAMPGRSLPPGGAVAVYDLGGGTFDVAVVGRSSSGVLAVLSEAGLPDLGGLDFDQSMLDYVGRTASAADPGAWQQLLRPADATGRRAARALAEDIRAAKETLSQYAQTEIALPDPFVDAHVTRTEFQGLIRPNLARSVEVVAETLRRAGIAPSSLTGIFLVGGSSRIPLVATLLREQLGIIPAALDQPETAVALGALIAPLPSASGSVRGPDSGPHSGPGFQRGPTTGRPGVGRAGEPGVGRPTVGPPTPAPFGPTSLGAPAAGARSGETTQVAAPASARTRVRVIAASSAVAVAVIVTLVVLFLRPDNVPEPIRAQSGGTDLSSSAPASISGASGSTTPTTPTTPTTTSTSTTTTNTTTSSSTTSSTASTTPSTTTSSTPTTPSTTRTTSPVVVPPVAATQQILFNPFANGDIAGDITVTSTDTGTCGSSIGASGNANARRCFAGDNVYDPCFVQSAQATLAVCVSDPTTGKAAKLKVTQDDGGSPSQPLSKAPPWFLLLANGQHCQANTGANGEYNGLTESFSCVHGKVFGTLFGAPDRSTAQWTITYQQTGQSSATVVGITKAWF